MKSPGKLAPQLVDVHETAATPVGGNSRERIAELLASAPRLTGEHGLEERRLSE